MLLTNFTNSREKLEVSLMTEEKVHFKSGDLVLEGLLARAEGSKGVVVSHPHPLYGGDMQNNVVTTLVRAYQDARCTTLRFNFRGVGGSEGSYDDGRGEQNDVKAALDHLVSLGCTNLDLVGYSFGAWVNAMGGHEYPQIRRLNMVSPPVAFLDFSALKYIPEIAIVVSGSRDDIAPPPMIREMIDTWNPEAEFRVIEGADHFYSGYEEDLFQVIREFLGEEAGKAS
jgi:uncharacterized protein